MSPKMTMSMSAPSISSWSSLCVTEGTVPSPWSYASMDDPFILNK